MDKKILVYNESKEEYKTVTFQEQVISVKTRLSVEDISKLLATYILEYFNEEESVETRVMLAEYRFSSTLFDLVTNFSIPDDIFTEVANTSLFEEVESKIDNLYEVEDLIFKTVQNIQAEKQVSKRLSELADKIYGLVDNFSSMPLDEDFLEKISQTAREIKDLGIEKETSSFLKKEKEEDVSA